MLWVPWLWDASTGCVTFLPNTCKAHPVSRAWVPLLCSHPSLAVTGALCKWSLHGGLTPRLRLHEEKVIKDRRHHLKTYPNCFVAKELIDWLIDHKEASDRETAIKLVQKLLDHSIIHHGKCNITCWKVLSSIYWLLWDKGKSHSYSSAKCRTGRILSLPGVEHLLSCAALQGHLCPEGEQSLKRSDVPHGGGKLTGDCDVSPEQPQLDRVPPFLQLQFPCS